MKLLHNTALIVAFVGLTGCGRMRGPASLSIEKDFTGTKELLLVHKKKSNAVDTFQIVSDTNRIKNGSYDAYLKQDAGQFWLSGTDRDGDVYSDVYKVEQQNLREIIDRSVIPGFEKPWIGDIYLNNAPKVK